MSKISFFHCGDIHLDLPFTTLANQIGLPKKRRKSIMNTFCQIIDLAKEEKPNFMFVAGDLYEQNYSSIKTINWLNNKFSEIEDTRVILIAGNHDQESNNCFYRTMNWSTNVYFLGEQNHSIYFEDLNTMIYGIGFSSGVGQRNKINSIECETNKINILLFHGDIDIDIGTRDYNSISSKLLDDKGFIYVATNHNHKYRNDLGEKKIIHNAGSIEALGFDEEGNHGFIKGSIENYKLKTEFALLNECIYRNIEIQIDETFDEEKLISVIRKNTVKKNFMYRIVIMGVKEVEAIIDCKKIEFLLKKENLYLKIKDKTKIKKVKSEITSQKGLKNIFIKKITLLMNDSNEESNEILKQALVYGLQAIEEQEIEIEIEENNDNY